MSPNYDDLHPHMRDSFRAYIEHGLPPGSFMTALLSNDLRETFACADYINQSLVREYLVWLWDAAPSACWGSRERVDAWIEMHAKTRAETEPRR